MITNFEKLEESGILAPVSKERIGFDGEDTRFHLVVVDGKHVVDTVTDQWECIGNRALVNAAATAAEIAGLGDLRYDFGSLNLRNGNSIIAFDLPDVGSLRVAGDDSPTRRQLVLKNNYAGRAPLWAGGGFLRAYCSNGMWVFDADAEGRRIHIGIDDLDSWALEIVSSFVSRIGIFDTVADIAGRAEWSRILHGEALVKTAPKRYREALTDAINSNRDAIGATAWAAMQAVTEIATHEMKNTVTAQKWSNAAIEKVLADIGESWASIEATVGVAA